MSETVFIRADEIAKELGIAKQTAYRMIRIWNEQLKAKGYMTITGRVSRQYYKEQIYGLTERKEETDASI